ncbi:MAG: hypothetical protein ACTHOO_04035 [Alcanivorax sp.]
MQEKVEEIQNIISQQKLERQKIIVMYIVFFLSFAVAIIPVSAASVFALMICVCTLSTIYSFRMNAQEDSLLENHTTYLIRTFWHACLYLIITSFVAFLFILVMIDYESLSACPGAFTNALNKGNFTLIGKIFKVCSEIFYQKNLLNIQISTFIAFFPVLLYLLLRCVKGWSLIVQYKMVPDAKL